MDIELDPEEHENIDPAQLGFYISLGPKLLDVLVMQEG